MARCRSSPSSCHCEDRSLRRLYASARCPLERVSKAGEPVIDGSYENGRFVVNGKLVEPGGHAAVAFEPVDAALRRRAGVVVGRGGYRRPATTPSTPGGQRPDLPVRESCSGSRASSGERGMAWEEYALSARTISGRVRGRARPQPGYLDPRHDPVNCGASPRWTGRHHQRQQPPSLLTRQVQLGRQAAPGAPEGVFGRLGPYPTGRLGLRLAAPRYAGRVLMGPADRRVYSDLPADQASRAGPLHRAAPASG